MAACGTADQRVDPADLELRDLLGVLPQPASRWSAEQRAAARRVITASLEEDAHGEGASARASEPLAAFRDELARDAVVTAALARWDDRLADDGRAAHALLRVTVTPGLARATVRPALRMTAMASGAEAAEAAATVTTTASLQLAAAWADEPLLELSDRGGAELVALARDAGHAGGPVVAVPAPRLVVLGAYLESHAGATPRLLVNPILLAALEPEEDQGDAPAGSTVPGQPADGAARPIDDEAAAEAGGGGVSGGPDEARAAVAPEVDASAIGGNPYSFYGSVAECAYAQRLRCQACTPRGDCRPITSISDGVAECEKLAANGGRGYFLQCINLSLAITSIERCAALQAPACARETGAASSLATLAANADFLDDPTCRAGLDGCLAAIYGEPDGPFPEPGDDEPGEPPRDLDVSCGNSCDDDRNNGNCSADPSFECEGPSCNNSFSCDSACSSSNGQSGCGDSGGGDDSGCGGSDDGGDDSGCGDSDDSGDSGCGGSDDSGDSGCGGSGDSGCGGDCGGGDGSGCSDSGCGGDSGGCGGSGDSGCGGGGGCNDSSSGDSGSKCSVAPAVGPSQRPLSSGRPPAILSFLLMGLWGLAPIPAAMLARRSALRRARVASAAAEAGAAPERAPTDGAGGEEVAR